MPGSGLSFDWERCGSTAQLVLDGELDAESAAALSHRAGALLDEAPAELVVDASRVTLCDSAGITALFQLNGRAEERGIQFVLMNLNASVYRGFDANRSAAR